MHHGSQRGDGEGFRTHGAGGGTEAHFPMFTLCTGRCERAGPTMSTTRAALVLGVMLVVMVAEVKLNFVAVVSGNPEAAPVTMSEPTFA